MLAFMALIRTATPLDDTIVTNAVARPEVAASADPALRGRVFNRVADRTQKGIQFARGGQDLDAITQFFFDDVSSGLSAASAGGVQMAMGLSQGRIDELQPILCLQNRVIAPPTSGAFVKRMSILRKRPDVSTEDFQDQWFNMHSVLVRRLPGILGYRQNLVIDGPRDADGHFMVDGMVELWFPDGAAIEHAFQSDIGNTTMMHAREFIAEITTFLVVPTAVSGVS